MRMMTTSEPKGVRLSRRKKSKQRHLRVICTMPYIFLHCLMSRPVYRGSKALELYLQSYQLILWKQSHALIHTIGLPAELEQIIKDLWSLRLRLLAERLSDPSDDNAVFSSQTHSETETDGKGSGGEKILKVRCRATPSLIETLGICYLGTILLRLPVSIGDLHR